MRNFNPLQLFCKIGMHQASDCQRWVGEDGKVIVHAEVVAGFIREMATWGKIDVSFNVPKLKIENWCGWHRGWY